MPRKRTMFKDANLRSVKLMYEASTDWISYERQQIKTAIRNNKLDK